MKYPRREHSAPAVFCYSPGVILILFIKSQMLMDLPQPAGPQGRPSPRREPRAWL